MAKKKPGNDLFAKNKLEGNKLWKDLTKTKSNNEMDRTKEMIDRGDFKPLNDNKKRKEGIKQVVGSYGPAFDSLKTTGSGLVNLGKGLFNIFTDPLTGAGQLGMAVGDLAKGAVKGFKAGLQGLGGFMKTIFNHKEWYTNYPVKGLVNANFGINKAVQIPELGITSDSKVKGAVSAAGMGIHLVVPITQANEWQQAINLMYSQIRAANAGAVNYDQYALEKYILAVRTLHAQYATLRRAYALLRNVSLYDSKTPASYFAAMGLDYVTFANNAANLRMFGSKMSTIISRLTPLKIDLLERTRWMFSNAFLDDNDAKSTPKFMYLESSWYATSNGTIKFHYYKRNMNATSTGLAYNKLIEYIQDDIDTITSDSTFSVIAGDILKAFGSDAIYEEEVWGDNVQLPFVYDEAMNTQIQNATCFGLQMDEETDPTTIITAGVSAWATNTYHVRVGNMQTQVVSALANSIVNSYKDDNDAGDVLALTRLVANIDTTAKTVSVCGTEIPGGFDSVYSYSASSNYGKLQKASNSIFGGLNGLEQWVQISKAPRVGNPTLDGSNITAITFFFDLNNYAIVPKSALSSYHGYAALSLTAIPRLVKVNKTELINK